MKKLILAMVAMVLILSWLFLDISGTARELQPDEALQVETTPANDDITNSLTNPNSLGNYTSFVASGHNGEGQSDVGDWIGIQQVSAGTYHTVALKSQDTVVSDGNYSAVCHQTYCMSPSR